ncbi:hypothetical protein KUF71_010263 [Frankliniella fusca]|uniref:CCHC-type domain-containing protein n=1 Tax=Frankliniella fusca TaxID=407009 RepID=A0AAE1LIM3_9NEOP|nr:hypothetical protein KUF71_010263 [Frankliniella fusca]
MASSRFPSFDPNGTQKWTLYYQKFLFHCQRHGLNNEEQKKAELLSIASDEFFEFCQAVCRRELHDETLTFARICTSVEEHLCPQPNEIVAAGKFHARKQQQGETVSEFMADLRKLARPANFGASLDRMIRDRLVLGLANQEAQAWLFRLPDLTLDKAVETALSVEASNNHVAESAEPTVNLVSKQNKGKPSGTGTKPNVRLCFRCDGEHSPDDCRHANSRCNFCGFLGHIERACQKKKRGEPRTNFPGGNQQGQKPNGKGKQQKKPRAQANAVNSTPEQQGLPNQQGPQTSGGLPNQQANPQLANANFVQQQPLSSSWGGYECFAITPQVEVTTAPAATVSEWDLPKPRYIELNINGTRQRFQVDSACPVTMMGEQVFSRIFPRNVAIHKSELALGMWDNAPVKDLGFVWIKLTHDGEEHTLRLYIGKGQGACLLGRQWFNALKIRLDTDAVCNVVPRCYRGPPVTLRIQPGAKPRRLKARRVAFARMQAVELEIRRMVEEQVWRGPLETAEWSTPVVPVFKEDRPRPRLCIDYRSTLNPVVEMDEPGKQHGNADALSRLCAPGSEPQDVPEPPGLFLITGLHSPHLSAEQVAAETAKDPVLLHVMKWTVEGWPTRSPEGEFTEYFKKKDAITTSRGCLLWGCRIIVPRTLQDAAMRHLHAAHMGVVRTKALARILMWAERCVRTVKEHLKRLTGNDWKGKLCAILDALRTTPGPDGMSPNQKLFKREIRNFFSLCLPKPLICVDGPDLDPKFSAGDPVWFKSFNAKTWTPAAVTNLEGNRMAVLDSGHHRHFDQMRRRAALDPPRTPPSPPAARPPPSIRVLGDLPARTPVTTPPQSPPHSSPETTPPNNGLHESRSTNGRKKGVARGKVAPEYLRRSERLRNKQPGRQS